MEIIQIQPNIFLCSFNYFISNINLIKNEIIINTSSHFITFNNLYNISKKDLKNTSNIINFINFIRNYNIIIIKDLFNNNAFKFLIIYFMVVYNFRLYMAINHLKKIPNFNSYINNSLYIYEFILFDYYSNISSSCNFSIPLDID
jgi:hypothetical protein